MSTSEAAPPVSRDGVRTRDLRLGDGRDACLVERKSGGHGPAVPCRAMRVPAARGDRRVVLARTLGWS